MNSTTAPLRFVFYNRHAVDPALGDSRAVQAQAESVRQFLDRFTPLEIITEDRSAACALRPQTNRFAFYARINAGLPAPQRQIVRQRQYALCASAAHTYGGILTAAFFDPATPATTPFHQRPGGAALLRARTDLDGLIVANFARLGTGTQALAESGLPVVLADLDTVIPPDDWDTPLARILTGLGT